MLKLKRRAKIVCTIGPATRSPEMLGKLIKAGMNAARINFSHGSHEDHGRTYEAIRTQASIQGTAVTVLADLQGPKIRVGMIPDPGLELAKGDRLVLTCAPDATTEGKRVPIDYPSLCEEAKPGDTILMDDGEIEAVVESIDGTEITAEMRTDGLLKSRKGVNLPDTVMSLPSMTDKDIADLRYALELGVDMVALSFVRKAADLEAAHAVMKEVGRKVPLIAKVEKPEAIENLDEIIDTAEGIMVARGDLGVEMGPEEVPLLQKTAIDRTNRKGKLVITATQMLDSMIRNPRPTRAEASDVANAILDGSDAVMLSGETAVGKYPIRTVETMDRIVRRIERAPQHWDDPPEDMAFGHGANAIARAAVASARSLHDTRAIVIFTGSGGTARLISEYRPKVPIYAFTPDPNTYQSLAVYWGVVPILFSPSSPGGESIFIDLDRAILDRSLLERDDRVIMVMGYPLKDKRSANLLKIHRVGQSLNGG